MASADRGGSEPDATETYGILRTLTSPLVAVTVREGDRLNGMVANSAVRASLVPGRQHVAHYVFKRHLTHEILARTGRYVLQVLSRDQWEEIWSLGFRTGHEAGDKLEGLDHFLTDESRLPVLSRCWAWMECRVANVMDAGASTFFMGRVLRVERGSGPEVMDSAYFRAHMPGDWRAVYEEKLGEAQALAGRLEAIDDSPWRDLNARARSAG